MKFTLEIELGDEAMQTYNDIGYALQQTAAVMFRHDQDEPVESSNPIRDLNGNIVGGWVVIDERTCAVCGVSAPVHGHWNVKDSSTHQWRAR